MPVVLAQEWMDPTNSGFDHAFIAVFVIVAVVIALVAVFTVANIARNAAVFRRAGVDPMTLQSKLAIQLSQRLSSSSLEQRLAELDALLGKGAISPTEHATARAHLLTAPPR